MVAADAGLRARRISPVPALAPLAGTLILGVAFAAALALGLRGYAPPLALVIGGGLGALAVLAFALARIELAAAFGVLLLGVVRFEPAPPDIVLGTVVAVSLASGWFSLRRVPQSVFLLVGAYLALNVASSALAENFPRAIAFGLITLYLAALALWLTSFVDSPARAKLLLTAFVYGASAVGALGTLALWVDPLASVGFEPDFYRAQSSFQDPNVFGHFLIPAMLLVLDELLVPRLLPGGRLVKLALLASITLGILFSYSRSAWAGAVLGAVVVFSVHVLRRGGSGRAFRLVVLAAAASLAIAGTISSTGSGANIDERAKLQRYDEDRFATQRAGLALAASHPLGIGPGQFEERLRIAAHSTYVRAVAEHGVLGLVTIVALMLLTLVIAFRNAMLGRHTYGIGSAPLLGAWLAIVFASFVIDTIHWRHLWFVAALVWAGSLVRRDPGTPHLRVRRQTFS
jgi:O-antigen ligase